MLFDSYVAKLIKNVTSYLKYLMKYPTPDMGTRQGQGTQGLDVTVLADIKMIPHRAETSRLVVTEQLLGGVIPGGACGAAMNDDIFHGSGGCHHRAVLLSEESTFVRDLFLTDYHRESFLNHG